jgi:hypothetical protein
MAQTTSWQYDDRWFQLFIKNTNYFSKVVPTYGAHMLIYMACKKDKLNPHIFIEHMIEKQFNESKYNRHAHEY